MEFLNEDFADAQSMIDKIHDSNAHLMISIWSSFGPQTKQYREMKPKGLLLPFQTWPQSGLSPWPPRMDYPSGVEPYDVFSKEARDIYWKNLLRLEKMGIDAWWMDSTEPDHLSFKESDLELPTADGSFRSVRNAYPLWVSRVCMTTSVPILPTEECAFLHVLHIRASRGPVQMYGAETYSPPGIR